MVASSNGRRVGPKSGRDACAFSVVAAKRHPFQFLMANSSSTVIRGHVVTIAPPEPAYGLLAIVQNLLYEYLRLEAGLLFVSVAFTRKHCHKKCSNINPSPLG